VTPDTDALLAEARDWLAAHVPPGPLPSVDTAEGFDWHRAWERALAAARLSVVSWPAEYGGRDASLLEWLAFEEAYYAAGGPVRVGQNGLFLLAPTLFAHGTKEQRDRLLPPMARADEIWAQAWSEPEAGSDLAAIRSRAVATDGGWLLSGVKTWSSRAAFADRAFGLFRTSAGGGDKHRGLTYLLFGLRDPGVTVRPIRQLGGETGFAEIFLDDVFVPDANVVGAPGDGWRIAMSTAGHERGLSLRSPGRFVAAAGRLGEFWRQAGDRADGATADRVADAWIGARAYQLHTHATAVRLAGGGTLGAEASMGKVFWSELDIALHETALDLLGPAAEIRGQRWLEGYLFALAGPIYAGTNEIQRTVIAERVLRLPRASARPGASDLRQTSPPPGVTPSRPDRFQPPPPSGRPPVPPGHSPVPAWAEVLHDLLSAADGPAAARSWADGDLGPGRALWGRLAGLGVTALAVPEEWGGLGASATDLATACEELGHHAVPGPVAESLAAVPTLLAALAAADRSDSPDRSDSAGRCDSADRRDSAGRGDSADRRDSADRCGEWLAALATGDLIATMAMPPRLPFAADAEVAGLVLLAEADAVSVGRAGLRHRSVDPSRSLSVVTGDVLARSAAAAVSRAWDLGALASSAQLLGAGRALLEASVRHASVRAQFGQPVGTFQAVKHKLADVAIALEFARPLLDAAAAAITDGAATTPRDVSAAKVACSDAATLAARAALQVHGAIGYTAEHDLSLWLTKVRALAPAWGSQAWHRRRVLAALSTSPVAGREAASSRSSTAPAWREGRPRWA
jgi:alkylation response protein AidB-like acyl-CoA dehydrogenase